MAKKFDSMPNNFCFTVNLWYKKPVSDCDALHNPSSHPFGLLLQIFGY